MSSTTTESGQVEPRERAERPSWAFWVGIAVVLVATGYVVTSAMGNTVHYYDVDQAVSTPGLVGETMRLRGQVVAGSHRVREHTLDQHVFLLGLNQHVITVTYSGALPDGFKDGSSVIATGRLLDAQTFEADSVTAQCPSRYQGAPPTAAGMTSQAGPSDGARPSPPSYATSASGGAEGP